MWVSTGILKVKADGVVLQQIIPYKTNNYAAGDRRLPHFSVIQYLTQHLQV
jgi:hypothetical protein